MKFKLFLPFLLLFLLSGCSMADEPNNQYMVSSLGFERVGDKLKAYVQAVDLKDGEQNGQPTTFVIEGEGDSVKAAIDATRAKLSKELSLKHTELIVVSDSLETSDFSDILSLSEGLEVSLRTKIAASKDVGAVLKNEGVSAGIDLVSLINQNARTAGFGGHTALFEIKTAFLLGEDFAVTYLSSLEQIGVEGLYFYKEGRPTEILNFEQSVRYAKEKNLYEGK